MRGPIFGVALLLCAACGGGGRSPDADAQPAASDTPPASPAPTSTTTAPSAEAGAPSDACTAGDAVCLGKDRRRACVANGAGSEHWIEESCAAGSGCFKGVCTPSRCSDECTLGETNAGKTCAPID